MNINAGKLKRLTPGLMFFNVILRAFDFVLIVFSYVELLSTNRISNPRKTPLTSFESGGENAIITEVRFSIRANTFLGGAGLPSGVNNSMEFDGLKLF
jgi:hypothetical protein